MIRNFKPQRLILSTNRCPNYQTTVLTNFKTEQSSNDYISSLCKQTHFKEALQAFEFIQNNTHFQIYLSTYAYLISACSSVKSLEYGQKIHTHLLECGSEPDIVLQNHILTMYGKCGSLKDAKTLFDEMGERNVVSWTSVIAGYTQNCREGEAMDLYFGMCRSGIRPDHFTFGSIIKACLGLGDIELGKQLHTHVVKSEFGSHLIPQNALVAMYAKFGRIDDAADVFNRIESKDLISWGSMIAGFSQLGYELEAMCLFKEMLLLGLYQPNEFIFGSVFSACASLYRSQFGRQAHGMSIKFGLGTNVFAGCSLSDMYSKFGMLQSAKTVFFQIENPDLISWNAIISGFAYSDDADEAMLLFSQMRHFGFLPDRITIRSLLCAFTSGATLCQGQQVHSYIFKIGFNLDVPVCNTLLTMYTKCLNLSGAFKIFEEMGIHADLVSWNAILTACMQHKKFNEVFLLLKLMHYSEIIPDDITLINVLGACSEVASVKMGSQIHGYALKTGLEAEASVMNGLIDTYTKCGVLSNARELFESMSNPDVISWSSLIVGYAQFGNGEEALKLFQRMRSLGVRPNQITFVGVLSACSHIELVEEGLRLYKIMETDYGIAPTREHCSCVIDLLARSGHLKEAEAFINQMPYDPDIVVWLTLLSACRTHGNLEIGKRAAESILKLDPMNSAAHVLLCNIYASNGSWNDVSTLRKLMKTRGVSKVQGQSWIEVGDAIHVFSVEDRFHTEQDDIYIILGELWLHMREAGYVPDQNLDLNEHFQE